VCPANTVSKVMRGFKRSGSGSVQPLARVLLGSLLFPLLLFGSGASAAETDSGYCNALQQAGKQNRIPNRYFAESDLGRKVQAGLATIFADDPAYQAQSKEKASLHDDRIGPVTRGWLKRFCVDYPVYGTADKVPRAVMESALHYAEIAQRHPDWRTTITAPEFEAWIHDISGESDNRQIRRSGAAPVVIGLLDEFAGSLPETTETTQAVADESCELLLGIGLQTNDPRLSLKSRSIGKKVQQGLQAVFAGNPEYDSERDQTDLLFDGKVGVQTRKWMAHFCREFPVAGSTESFPDNVVSSLLHYAEISGVHPDWREILKDQGFNQWIVQPALKGEPGNRQLRLSGSAPIINELITQYLRWEESAGEVDTPITECPEETAGGAAVYYQLSEQDWQQLQEREEFLGQVEKLVGKKFDTLEDLGTAIGPTADRLGNKCVRNKFVEAIQGGVHNPTTEYRLTSESLDRIIDQLTLPGKTDKEGDIRFSANVISALEQLQDKGFPSKSSLAQFVRFKAKLALAGESASPPGVGSTSPAAEIQSNPTGEDANPPTLPGAAKIEDEPEGDKSEGDKAERVKFKGFKFEGDRAEENKPEGDRSEGDKPEEDGGTAAPVASSAAPPAFESGENSVKIDTLVRQVVAAAERKAWSYEITDEAVNALKGERGFIPFPESDLVKLKTLLEVAYVSTELYATAVHSALGSVPDIEEKVPAIVDQARKMGDEGARLAVRATDYCQCSRRWDSVGRNHFTVYGFYPSWLSAPDSKKMVQGAGDGPPAQAGEESQEQERGTPLDFGIFSRLGYFALELNEDGKILDRKHWSEARGAGRFIRMAHKYLTKVDLVIEARYWQSWGQKDQAQAVAEIWDLLDPNSRELPTGVVPDGVTIYFPGFVHSVPQKNQKIVDFLMQLHGKIRLAEGDQHNSLVGYLGEQLSGRDNRLYLNILIGADSLDLYHLEPDKRLLGNLKFLGDLKDVLVGDEQIVDLVLVLLGQPVFDVKKKLRLTVENEFQGEERINVLRRIVPVIPPNGHKEQDLQAIDSKWGSADDPYRQLHHDLLYFRDNFRGVAFWPALPATNGEQDLVQMSEVNERLIGVFSQSGEQGEGGWIGELLGQDPCVFVCPNRWYLKVLFFVLLGGLMLFAVLAYWSCRFRTLLRKNVLLVLTLVAMLILMFVAFITCVPTWQDQQETILMSLLVLIIGFSLFYYIRKVKQGPLP